MSAQEVIIPAGFTEQQYNACVKLQAAFAEAQKCGLKLVHTVYDEVVAYKSDDLSKAVMESNAWREQRDLAHALPCVKVGEVDYVNEQPELYYKVGVFEERIEDKEMPF